MAKALGIDFGGTKILAGVVDTSSGEVLASAKKRTHADRGGQEVIDRVRTCAQEALDAAHVKPHDLIGVGIGVAGQVDAKSGALIRAPNLPNDLLGGTVLDTIKREFGLPVNLVNDVAAAAAGEAAFGAGKGHPDFVCVFVGTGIGGAIYVDGKPYTGATNTAGELGHMVVDYNGRICGCGGRGHLEAYASRTAIVRSILAAMRQGRPSVLHELVSDPNPDDVKNAPIRSKALADAVSRGDDLAKEMLDHAARYLAAGLVSIVNFYNPPRLILGGGVIDVIDRLFDHAVHLVHEDALQVPRQKVDIVKAALGDFSGVVGSASLAHG